MSRRSRRLTGAVVVSVAATAGLIASSTASWAAPDGPASAHPGAAKAPTGDHGKGRANGPTMDIQILSFNDFHGNLEPPTGSSGRIVAGHQLVDGTAKDVTVDAGGVAYLATHLKQARKGHRNTVTVAAGDIVGASPLLSAAFHDEPTILAMNKLGLDATAVGNHEFDEGYQEIQRLQKGGCLDDGDGQNNQNSCPTGSFPGANFQFLAANVTYQGTKRTILPAYWVKKMHGAKIGFIGMTLKDTPNIVTAAGVAGLDFHDEVATANALVPVLEKQGVKAIVVLIHQGGFPTTEKWTDPQGATHDANPSYDWACSKGGALDPSSPILPIAQHLSPQIDLVISGHTHQPYVCDVPDPNGQPRLVTSASSFGRLYTDTELSYDRRTQDIVRSSVKGTNMVVTRDVAPSAAESTLIQSYQQLVAPIANKVLGTLSTDVTRKANAAGESQLGDLIADAQLADPSVVTDGKEPVVALMNPGGIRADLLAGEVTYEDAFTVQPFNNYLVSMDLTGSEILQVLEEQWSGVNSASNPKVLQVAGIEYAWSSAGGTRHVVPGSVTVNGMALDEGATYRIVTNNFLAGGGDGFGTLGDAAASQTVYYGGLDIDAFATYLEAHSPYTPGPLTRITQQ
ncbi:MAG TPA: bifunctional metallophosphatase/5'-nucleotidase [Segeticoccus sp.]|uniref:bifunctional metallophosphatase/5'-nucleotidase n=1 Tax=Segeticoccus sp. TaxID=2706531 RepID=UPI002D7F31AF|nr:bifunctional metallophosphatase/5'-nucleotidase [Segeticoccus sp.]HET8600623.1 bifunctional metallophosphatase/5'-nucleotidase [Segeticoccus sp.]